jgi:hypothetical protein
MVPAVVLARFYGRVMRCPHHRFTAGAAIACMCMVSMSAVAEPACETDYCRAVLSDTASNGPHSGQPTPPSVGAINYAGGTALASTTAIAALY